MIWHTSSVEQTLEELNTRRDGLTAQEAHRRLEQYGPNEMTTGKKRTIWSMILAQFMSFMIWVLLAAAALSIFMDEVADAVIILAIVILNAVIGVIQENKAEKSLEALKRMSAPMAKVLRDGQEQMLPASQLVPGDIVLLEAGDVAPADLRLMDCSSLQMQEAALTGESTPVQKQLDAQVPSDAPLGDRVNMVFASSLVTYGRGAGMVTETGMRTQVGNIARMLQDQDETQTPLKRKLEQVGKILGLVAIGVCMLLFLIGVLNGRDWVLMFMVAVSLAVAAIPEGLPAIATIVLAMGVQRMVKRNAIIRQLPSVETLGSATVICSDKTGTLTQNRMTVLRLSDAEQSYDLPEFAGIINTADERASQLMRALGLCIDARITEGGSVGDPTEIALMELGNHYEITSTALNEQFPRVWEQPFDSDRKRMSTLHRTEQGFVLYSKGAADTMLPVCTRILQPDGTVRDLTPEDRQGIERVSEQMALQALRVLAFASKFLNTVPQDNDKSMEEGLTFIGMVGMMDPPRIEVKAAVEECVTAGIKPVMITGDHVLTAITIARELLIYKDGDRALTGQELEAMDDEQLFDIVREVSVYARVSPEHKLRIVNAWQRHGHVVAMTGDGVNDAPALKKADIGAAMGITGTEVAKEAADMILTDDNFTTIVAAVEEGRRVYDNIVKAVQFLLSCNVGEILVLFVATLLNWENPLLPIHILWINLISDSLPALALGIDPPERDLMLRKPISSGTLFTSNVVWRIAYQGLMVGALTLLAYRWGEAQSHAVGQTMAFCVLGFSQLTHAFNLRSATRSIFSGGVAFNWKLLGAVFCSGLLMSLVLFVPTIREIFELTHLTGEQWLFAIGLSFAPVLVVELMKLLRVNEIRR